MQFLKTLFWVALAVLLVLFASFNWTTAQVRLWGGLIVDIKLPVLVVIAFLLGFVPMLIVDRAKVWSLKRKIEAHERSLAASAAQPAPPADVPSIPLSGPPTPPLSEADRVATDSNVWPAR